MPVGYERLTEFGDVLTRARELALRTMIFDIEPLVAWWGSGQQALDDGIAKVLAEIEQAPEVRVVVFATNSARRPSVIPPVPGVRVSYLATAEKPLRTAPYRDLPRPGAVIGDQVPTDGLLAWRLGFTFMHWDPPLPGAPLRPRLMRQVGRLVRPLFFPGRGAGRP